jgi:hypothetical protein
MMNARIILAAALACAAPLHAQERGAAQHLEEKGFVRCAKNTGSVLEFLYEKQPYAYLNTWHLGAPDRHSAATLTARPYADANAFASVISSPTTAGGCDVAFSQFAPLAQPCAKVHETTFKDWKKTGELSGAPVYADPTAPNVVVVLFPMSQASCLVVKSGMLYF